MVAVWGMEAIAEPPAKPVNYRQKRVNYALAAVLVSKGLSYEEAAQQTGAKNGKSLQVGLGRKGIRANAVRDMLPREAATKSETAMVVSQASEILRDKLGDVLSSSVAALATKRVKYKDLASRGQGHMATLKTATEAYKALYGGSEANVVVFGLSMMESGVASAPIPQPVASEANPPIDIDAQASE